MEQITKGPIQPLRLGPDSRFQFRCHKDVKCFTQCCRGINIILTPYDIIGLKNRLGLSSGDFLAVYTELQMLEKTDVPVVTLKLLDEEGAPADRRACPFVRPEGCIVYEDRPTSCRYYPLGVASLAYKDDPEGDEFFSWCARRTASGSRRTAPGPFWSGARTRGWTSATASTPSGRT